MLIDFSQTEAATRYKLMSQSIIPRPIAWIVTEDGGLNIAPFSFFSGIASNPPTVMVAVGHKKDGTPKDTLRNIRTTRKCVICSVLPEALEKMHYSSAELDSAVDEAEHFDIDTERLYDGYPPMIKGAPTAFFCTLTQEVPLEGSKTIPLFLHIDHMYLDDAYANEKLHFDLDLLARTGKAYARLGDTIPAPEIPQK
jgi:flavin reductase (DIM6/NTAB) family NADH-FMN oxidoreductase RutF